MTGATHSNAQIAAPAQIDAQSETRSSLTRATIERMVEERMLVFAVMAFGTLMVALAALTASASAPTPSNSALRFTAHSLSGATLDTVDFREAAFETLEFSPLDTSRRAALLDTATERTCLAEAIYFEARSEPVRGQKAVAEVVLNRVASRFYPDTICGVVYQGAAEARARGKVNCQFSFACDGSTERWTPVGELWTQARDLAAIALDAGFAPQTRGATHYHTNYVRPGWSRRLRRTTTIGTHKFYLDLPFRRDTPHNATEVAAAP